MKRKNKIMPISIEDLIALNQKSIDALGDRVTRLRRIKDRLDLDERLSVLATISDIDTRTRTLEFTQEHLKASQVVVAFSDNEAATLRGLELELDKQIAAGAQLNAILDTLPAVMNAAVRVNALINSHTAQA